MSIPGVVFEDANVKVTAFQNAHGEWRQSFGYQFKTADRTIVISGDTSPSQALIEHCQKCDVLVHEVYAEVPPGEHAELDRIPRSLSHDDEQLAEIAAKTQPGLLILYHRGVGPRGREFPTSSTWRKWADVQRQSRGRPRSRHLLKPWLLVTSDLSASVCSS